MYQKTVHCSLMTNRLHSILDRVLQIKENIPEMQTDIFFVLVILLVGISSFGLGRLSATETKRPAIRLYQQKTFASPPMRVGGMVVASRLGSKYRFPWCPGVDALRSVNRIWFPSIKAARAAGYSPARNCKGLE